MKRSIGMSAVLLASALLGGGIARAEPAGELDPTFGGTGKQVVQFGLPGGNNKAYELVASANGTLYLVGTLQMGGPRAIGLAAFDFDGYPSQTFGAGTGRVSYVAPDSSDLLANAAAVQPDGKIVVVGGATAANLNRPFACRFNTDGTIDTSFGTGGCRVLPLNDAFSGYASAVIVQSDGNIALAGRYHFVQPTYDRAFIGQLDANGKLTQFGSGGIAFGSLPVGKNTSFSAIAQAPDGALVAAGAYSVATNDRDYLVMKVDQTGTPVVQFNGSGYAVFPANYDPEYLNDQANALAVLDDGSILLAGTVATGAAPRQGLGIQKITPEGEIDLLFTNGDPTPLMFEPCNASCEVTADAIAMLPDGRIVVTGRYSDDLDMKSQDFFVWRLLPNGWLDGSFGSGVGNAAGFVSLGFDLENNHSEDAATGIVLQGERVVVGGYCKVPGNLNSYEFCMARLDHGMDDQSFTVTPTAGPHGSITPDDGIEVTHSGYAVFIVNPEPGYKVLSATGCGGAMDGMFYNAGPVVEDCTVQVTFGVDAEFILTYGASEGGGIIGPTPQNVQYGEDGAEVNAVPDAGYHFVRWNDGSLANPRKDLAVTSDINVIAEFAPNPVAVSVGVFPNGTVSPGGVHWVAPGSVLAFDVKPDPGFAVDTATGCGGTLDATIFTTAPIVADCAINISFAATDATYALLYATDGNGSIEGDSQQEVESAGDGTPVTAVPAPGFAFAGWSDGMTMNPRQDTTVLADVSVTAQFVATTPSIFSDEFED